MSFRTYDFQCPKCEYEEERMIDFRGCDGDKNLEREKMIIQCPNCDHPEMEQVWRRAPARGGAPYGSPEEVAKMKQSFNKRFIKKDLDDVRNKFGKLYDDNVRSVSAARIKKEVDGGND